MSAPAVRLGEHRQLLLLGLFVLSLVAAWQFVAFVTASGTRLERERVLALARTAAAALDARSVAGLTGTPADIGSPGLEAVRAELRRVRDANPDFRFVYLMRPLPTGHRELVFLADAELPESTDYSAPGDVYDGPDAAIRAVWDRGTPDVEPPGRDRWGYWVTGLSPVWSADGRVIAVLGMDMRADQWLDAQARYRNFAIAICVLVLLLELLFAVGLRLQRRDALRLAELNRQLARQLAEHERAQVERLQGSPAP